MASERYALASKIAAGAQNQTKFKINIICESGININPPWFMDFLLCSGYYWWVVWTFFIGIFSPA
jgi:hypothetical protein